MPYCWSSIIPTSTANGYSSRTWSAAGSPVRWNAIARSSHAPRWHTWWTSAGRTSACVLPAAPSQTFGYCRDVVNAAWIVSLGSACRGGGGARPAGASGRRGDPDSGEPGECRPTLADGRCRHRLGRSPAGARPRQGPGRPGGARPARRVRPSPRPIRDGVLSEAAGLDLGPVSPEHDVRLRMGPDGQQLYSAFHTHGDHAHHDEHEHLTGRVATVERIADDVRVLRTARLGLTDHPVLTWRPSTATAAWTMGTTPAAIADRDATRLLVQVLREMCEQAPPEPGARGPARLRGHRPRAQPGGARRRRAGARRRVRHVPGAPRPRSWRRPPGSPRRPRPRPCSTVTTSTSSWSPRRRARMRRWALRAIAAGKHVVLEKPFAIRTAEADEVLAAADGAGLLAVVYQNRRFDPDHLAVRRIIERGDIGEVFHIETFVGGYGHPCNLWHSDEGVSGGAFYDWGSHLLDQVLDLIPSSDRLRDSCRAQAPVVRRDERRPLAGDHPVHRWGRGRVHALGPRGCAQAPLVRPGHPRGHRGPVAIREDRRPQRHRDPHRGPPGARGLPSRAGAARGGRQRHPCGHARRAPRTRSTASWPTGSCSGCP